jgi:hypothetical protein
VIGTDGQVYVHLIDGSGNPVGDMLGYLARSKLSLAQMDRASFRTLRAVYTVVGPKLKRPSPS